MLVSAGPCNMRCHCKISQPRASKQVLPFASEETLSQLEQNVARCGAVTDMLHEGCTPLDITERLLHGLGVSDSGFSLRPRCVGSVLSRQPTLLTSTPASWTVYNSSCLVSAAFLQALIDASYARRYSFPHADRQEGSVKRLMALKQFTVTTFPISCVGCQQGLYACNVTEGHSGETGLMASRQCMARFSALLKAA